MDYNQSHSIMEQHRLTNKQRNKENWQSIVRYLSDGPKQTIPKTFEEGMEIWNNKIKSPNFEYHPVDKNISRTSNSNKIWAILTRNTTNKYSISQLDPECNILYVASEADKKEVQNVEKTAKKHKVQILSIDKQKSLQYRIKNHTDLDIYSKDILLGTLFLVSQGATSIQVPNMRSKGKYNRNCVLQKRFFLFDLTAKLGIRQLENGVDRLITMI